MSFLGRDVTYGLRKLLRSPGFTLASVLSLALGIGATTAVFSLVDGVLLRPLPYGDQDRLVTIRERSRNVGVVSVSWPNFLDWQAQSTVFESMGVWRFDSFNLTGIDDPERLNGRTVSGGYFQTLGVAAEIGRTLRPQDDRPGAGAVVVVSDGLWRRRFGADPGVLGRSLVLNGLPHAIVGVIPAALSSLQSTDVWAPIGPRLAEFEGRGLRNRLAANALLKPGVSLERARAELAGIAARLEAQYPDTNAGAGVQMDFVKDLLLTSARRTLGLLLGAVGFMLLIACANVANLLLVRAAGRSREMAIRTAVGAGRGRLVLQLLAESLMLALLGGATGLLAATWGIDLVTAAGGFQFPRVEDVRLSGAVLGFALAATTATGLLFGLAPAFAASRLGVPAALKEGGPAGGGGRTRLRSGLVVAEVALTLALLIGAGLLARSLANLQAVEPGFDPSGVLTASLSLSESTHRTLQPWAAFHEEVLDRLRAAPGVECAALATDVPMAGSGSESSFAIEGRPLPQPPNVPALQFVSVTPEYFRAMRIPLLKGRWFDDRDGGSSPLVAVVDETMARRHFHGEDPIGRRLAFEGSRESPIWREIVGVVGHTRHYGLEGPSHPQVYVPFRQLAEPHAQRRPDMSIVVRGDGGAADLAPAVRAAVRSVDRDQPVYFVRTLDSFVRDQTAQRRFSSTLMGVFAGAAAADVRREVLRWGMRLALGGVTIGLAGSLALTRLLSGLLYGVSTTDPATFAAAPALFAAASVLACWVPARRATKVDPVLALRCE